MSVGCRLLASDCTETGRWSISCSRFNNLLASILDLDLFDKWFSFFRLDECHLQRDKPRFIDNSIREWLTNSGAFRTICTVRSTNLSKAAEGQWFLTLFLFVVSSPRTRLLISSLTCTGILTTVSRTESYSLVRGVSEAVLMLASRSAETMYSAAVRNEDLRSGSKPVVNGARSWASVLTEPVCGLTARCYGINGGALQAPQLLKLSLHSGFGYRCLT